MFLPTSAKEIKALGWNYIDVILFSGDAYIDHPSFGAAVIGRSLEAAGYRVAIVPQPNWQDDLRDFKKFGAPRLFFGVSAGAMDSTVMHYTPTRRLRSSDAYTPGGRHGARPDYPTVVYSKILRELYPDSVIIAGGIEASLRRLTHYDYLQDRLIGSFAEVCNVDGLIYGMGEVAIVDIARKIERKKEWRDTPQVAFYTENCDEFREDNAIVLHSREECEKSKEKFGENFVEIERQSNMITAQQLIEPCSRGGVVVNAPYPIFSVKQCDETFELPYMRQPAPRYKGKVITAWDMIKHSVNIHRGCYGGCSFCAISMHQGKHIASRSVESIEREVLRIVESEDFRGTISDIGGPSANMWMTGGKNVEACEKCCRASCLAPRRCPNLRGEDEKLMKLYRRIQSIAGVKHLFIGSGIRYDLIDYSSGYFEKVVKEHTSGRLKVAPEHTEDHVVELMRKPQWGEYQRMTKEFENICAKHRLPYVIVPYFISAHPGCSEADMRALKAKTKGVRTDQVQDFTPTPMTLSSVMYYTGIDPYTKRRVYVARSKEDKDAQKSYFFESFKAQSQRGGKPQRGGYKQPYKTNVKKYGDKKSGKKF
ncbi:MAG: YgiQ family radical SAM protein [Rikenellaceae bacterium]